MFPSSTERLVPAEGFQPFCKRLWLFVRPKVQTMFSSVVARVLGVGWIQCCHKSCQE